MRHMDQCLFRRPILDLELLRTFVAVIEAGSFTDAADIVGRSQSTVSTQILKLEDTLGARLVRRGRRKIETTYEGRELLGFAHALLKLEERAVNTVRRPRIAGTIRLGTQDDFAIRHLPALLSRFQNANPEVQVEVFCDLAVHLKRQLEKGTIDLMLVRQHEEQEEGETLWRERLVWVGLPSTRIEKGQSVPLAVFPKPCFYRKVIDDAFKGNGLNAKVSYVGSSSAAVQEAVRAGLGVSVFAEGTLIDGMHLLTGEQGLPQLPTARAVLHRSAKRHSAAAEWLAEYLKHNLRPERGVTCFAVPESSAGEIVHHRVASRPEPSPLY